MSDPSGAVSDEKTGVDALEEKAWMMKETVFPDTTKHPIPDESCSRLEPLVQEELEFSWVSLEDPEFPDDPELPEEPPQQPTSRKLRKIKTVNDEIAEMAFNPKMDFIYRKFYLLQSKDWSQLSSNSLARSDETPSLISIPASRRIRNPSPLTHG